jgi:hypothetical protein
MPAPPCPHGDDGGEKREHTIPLKDADEDELRDMSGYGQVVEQRLERLAGRSENCCAERDPAQAVAPPRGELLSGVLPSSRLSISFAVRSKR